MKKEIHAYYTGQVQGVGFRFTAQDLGRRLGVVGWVRNLSNGQVEILAQAEEKTLTDFLGQIGKYFSRYIRDTEVEWLDAGEDLKDFSIKF